MHRNILLFVLDFIIRVCSFLFQKDFLWFNRWYVTLRVQSPENERKSASLCLIVLFLLSFTLILNKHTKSSQYMYKVIVTKMPQTAPQTQMIDVDKQG